MEYDDTKNHSFSSVAMSNTTIDAYDYPGETITLSELLAIYAEDKDLNLILFIVTLLELVTGTLGNLLVIAAVIVNKKLHKIHNVLVMNLAVADLYVSAFLHTVNLVGIRNNGKYLLANAAFCQFTGCLCTISCLTSFFTIAVIALNRYIRICHRLAYNKIFTKRTTIFLVLCIWGAAFTVDWIPYISQGSWHRLVPQVFSCLRPPSLVYGFIGLGLTVAIIIYCYLRIWLKVRASKRNLQKYADGHRRVALLTKTDYRLLRTLLILILAVVILVVPFTIVYNASVSVGRETFVILYTMIHFNSCINCVIYALTNTEYRRGYITVLSRCLHSKPRTSPVELVAVSKHVCVQSDQGNGVSKQLNVKAV